MHYDITSFFRRVIYSFLIKVHRLLLSLVIKLRNVRGKLFIFIKKAFFLIVPSILGISIIQNLFYGITLVKGN